MFVTKFKQKILSSPVYIFCTVFMLVIILLSLLAPFIPIDPNLTNVTQLSKGPSLTHLFGTDEVGRDYFIRVIYGGRVSLIVGLLSMITSTTIGVIIGLVSGYFGGKIDAILMRFLDVLSSIPWLVLVIVLSVFLKPGLMTIVIVIGCFSWMNTARLIRAETLSVKARDYVIYANFIGETPFHIIRKHIFPFVFPTLLVASTTSLANAIMTESALSYLGMGIQQPMASWGSLLQSAQNSLQRAPYMAIIPGLFILLTVYSSHVLGEAFKETLEEM